MRLGEVVSGMVRCGFKKFLCRLVCYLGNRSKLIKNRTHKPTMLEEVLKYG